MKKEKDKKKKMEYSKEWLSKKEVEMLFNYPEINSRDLLLMKLLYYGAFRISEVLNSKREHYKLEDDYAFLILYKQKTDKKNWEKQPIPVKIYGDINRYCDDNKILSQEYVFQSQKRDQLGYDRAYQIVEEWTKKASIKKNITTHSFRRSRATHLLDEGLSLNDVSLFLRHNSFETTRRYLKLSKKVLSNKVKDIDKKGIASRVLWINQRERRGKEENVYANMARESSGKSRV